MLISFVESHNTTLSSIPHLQSFLQYLMPNFEAGLGDSLVYMENVICLGSLVGIVYSKVEIY